MHLILLIQPLTSGATRLELKNNELDLKKDLYALVIGVSNYRAGWDPLPGVKSDFDAVIKQLALSGFQKSNITTLFDPERSQIEAAFTNLKSRLKNTPGSARLLIYYAGHGENLDKQGYLVPVDSPEPRIDKEGFRKKALSLDWIRKQFEFLPVRHGLMLLDNCFSGSVFKTMRGTAPYPPSINQMVTFPSREIVSAGTEEQRVPDESIFRRFFEAGMAGAADLDRDGYITGTELAIFIRSGVANESKGRQTPLFTKIEENNFHKGEFVIMSPLKAGNAPQIVREDASQPVKANRGTTTALRSGKPFQDCSHGFCPTMMPLPAGEFMYGSSEKETGRQQSEKKLEKRELSAFAISRTEVTFDQWDACFKDGGCNRWPDDMGWGRGDRPVVNITWKDASDFVAWLSMKTGKSYRLPDEVEWEYAARGGMTTARPWGDDLGQNMANCRDCGTSWGGKSTAPVGKYPQNCFGLYDMLGNVWEWTGNCSEPLESKGWLLSLLRRERNTTGCAIRGGSFSTGAKGVRSATRSIYPAERLAKNIGFRVMRELR